MNTEQIRTTLLQRLDELEKRSEQAERDASHRDTPLSADFAEQATEAENDQVLSTIADESRHEADSVREALKRIALGRYGICDQCGAAISEARLNALPHTGQCIDCAG